MWIGRSVQTMTAKHRKQSFTQRRLNTALLAGAAAVIGAGGYTAVAALSGADQAQSRPDAPQATVNQTGRVLSVTDTSMTAQGADGMVRTYQLTPTTARIPGASGRTSSASGEFAVDQVVTIVATVDDGTATATAVADQGAAAGQAPPMDWSSPT
jgi:hypothetical protein